MTVNISKPALNLREELAALRNQGGYVEQSFHQDGLVTNGTFDTDTEWTKGTGWTISSGVATQSGSASILTNSSTLEANKTYVFVGVISGRTAGVIYARAGSTLSSAVSANGNFSLTVTSNGTALAIQSGTGFDGALDNISVYEVDTNADIIHSLADGWLPKDVFVNGLLKREGSGWDYTVHTDGTKHWIKPTVAPSATTTTTILGVRA